MARYILIQVDDNNKADRLIKKLDPLSGVEIVGLFAQPTKFCECQPRHDKSIKGAKYGWWICPNCHKPKTTQHTPKNLLDPEGSHPGTHRWFLHTWEPQAWRQK